jgi:hypothetical protein
MDGGACFGVALLLALIFIIIVAVSAASNTNTTTNTTTTYYMPPRQEIKRNGISELKQIEHASQAELDQAYNRYVRRSMDLYAARAKQSNQPRNQK